VFNIIQNIVSIKLRKVKSLIHVIQSQYKNIAIIMWICTRVIIKNIYITCVQKLNQTLTKIDKHTYKLTYVINGVQYIIHIKTKRGPKLLLQALDDKDNDITEKIQAYLGPSENFHGHVYTPEFFGTNELTLSLSSGEEVSFGVNDTICL
jgi:hypothetical protein